jgi:hypothetical protein
LLNPSGTVEEGVIPNPEITSSQIEPYWTPEEAKLVTLRVRREQFASILVDYSIRGEKSPEGKEIIDLYDSLLNRKKEVSYVRVETRGDFAESPTDKPGNKS